MFRLRFTLFLTMLVVLLGGAVASSKASAAIRPPEPPPYSNFDKCPSFIPPDKSFSEVSVLPRFPFVIVLCGSAEPCSVFVENGENPPPFSQTPLDLTSCDPAQILVLFSFWMKKAFLQFPVFRQATPVNSLSFSSLRDILILSADTFKTANETP